MLTTFHQCFPLLSFDRFDYQCIVGGGTSGPEVTFRSKEGLGQTPTNSDSLNKQRLWVSKKYLKKESFRGPPPRKRPPPQRPSWLALKKACSRQKGPFRFPGAK